MFKFGTLLLLAVGTSLATPIQYVTSSSSVSGVAVSAEADFAFTAGQLTITLKNLQSGITTVGQDISDLEFIVSTGTLGASTTMSSSGQQEDCTSKPCVLGSTASTGWGFGTLGGENIICIVCGSANLTIAKSGTPSHTILGPNPNPGASFNGPHDPVINQTATFVISNPSITANSTVSGVVFSFGTEAGSNVNGCLAGSAGCGSVTTSATPEPVGVSLMGAGMLGLALLFKARRA